MSDRQREEITGSSDQDIEGQLSKNDGVDSGENKDLPEERNAPRLALEEEAENKTKKPFLHPEGPFLKLWNTIFVVSCMIAVSVDPLFFYIHVINEEKKCIGFDKRFRITAICLRLVTDLVYVVNIILQFLSPYIREELFRVLGRIVLQANAWEIAERYLRGYFIIDILAILPIPQVVMLIILPKMRGSKYLNKRKLLNSVVLLQYVPRFLRIILARRQLKAPRNFATAVFCRVAFSLALYFLVCHVLGAFWYFFSIERETACWHIACENNVGCVPDSFNCDTSLGNYTFLNGLCHANTTDTTLFSFGIFLEAIQSGILESTDFPKKFLYCFWWSLRNLSPFGQSLQTSTYFWENCFAVFISTFGLFVFFICIEDLQKYMQDTKRLREKKLKIEHKMGVKNGKIWLWVRGNDFPDVLEKEVLLSAQWILKENEDVDAENLFPHLPDKLRMDITRHICMPLLKKVPMLQNKDEELLKDICYYYLKPVHYKEHKYIIREGEPLEMMLFITKGIVWTYTTNDGERSRAQSLKKGDFYGEELLDWGFKASSLPDLSNLVNLPNSPKTVKTYTKVEAFALTVSDFEEDVVFPWQNVLPWQNVFSRLRTAVSSS